MPSIFYLLTVALDGVQTVVQLLKLIEAKHCSVCHKHAQNDSTDGVVPHHGDLHNRCGDVQCQDSDDDGDDEDDDVGGHLGNQPLDHLNDDVDGEGQQEHDAQQDG